MFITGERNRDHRSLDRVRHVRDKNSERFKQLKSYFDLLWNRKSLWSQSYLCYTEWFVQLRSKPKWYSAVRTLSEFLSGGFPAGRLVRKMTMDFLELESAMEAYYERDDVNNIYLTFFLARNPEVAASYLNATVLRSRKQNQWNVVFDMPVDEIHRTLTVLLVNDRVRQKTFHFIVNSWVILRWVTFDIMFVTMVCGVFAAIRGDEYGHSVLFT